jgi:hypothetical protein
MLLALPSSGLYHVTSAELPVVTVATPGYIRVITILRFVLQLEVQRFVMHLVTKLKKEYLFAWQGGPIILAQVDYSPPSYAISTV